MAVLSGELDPAEQRVLGALLEKQRTVPASYPLSLSALRTACNQTSSRDPVVDYDDRTVQDVLARLKERELVRFVWTGAGSRVLKYHQRLQEALELDPAEAAVLTVLLLRGPQAPGELRTRTERLHPFDDRDAVTATLQVLAGRLDPVVAELERRPGQQDRRWTHLLGPAGSGGQQDALPPAPAVDRDSVLADGVAARDERVRTAYDAMAVGYAQALADELDHKPFDRWLLSRVAELAPAGPAVDVGCGPGQVAALLAAGGRRTTGLDISPGMIEQARARHPQVEFELGDLGALLKPRDAAGWAVITAWYALVHLGSRELPAAVSALARTLTPGGVLALAVHLGAEVRRVDELFGAAVDIEFVLHDRDEVLAAVAAAGLTEIEWYVRGPDERVEVATERMYVLARAAAG